MAGIYIHIPFCTKKCYYCDFYSIASLKYKDEVVNSLIKELEWQKNYLNGDQIKTIYFGGGTPSLLSDMEINRIVDKILHIYPVAVLPEITLEANPEDITQDYLQKLAMTPVNRLSIGIQSFLDDELKRLNRRHNAMQAIEAVMKSQDNGFSNISIDLIYGIPDSDEINWLVSLGMAFTLNIRHISAYHLTIEPQTVFHRFWEQGKIKPIDEDVSFKMYQMLINQTRNEGFEQYEISNFCKTDFESIHNANYWRQQKYLGIGPSAHSYNLTSRQWNVANVKQYINQIENGNIPSTTENLDISEKYNEFLLTALRTSNGINSDDIETIFGAKYKADFLKCCKKYIYSKHIIKHDNRYFLSDKGKFISNSIISNLFYIEKEKKAQKSAQ